MRRTIRGTFFLVLLSALALFGFSQLRNLSQFTQDRINPERTYFILHENGSAEFSWASEWTHMTANAYEDKAAIFVWHFKDGSKAYAQQGSGIGEIGKNSGYLLVEKAGDLEDIHRKKIQPLTLNNYPIKIELWIGTIKDPAEYALETLGDEACFPPSKIEYNSTYRSAECPPK